MPLPAVQLAHQAIMTAIGAGTPHAVIGTYAADRFDIIFDIMERANHLQTILAAVHTYAKAIVDDPAHCAPIGYMKTGNVGLSRRSKALR